MEKMESQSSNSLRKPKPIRRRSHTRKIAKDSVINMAEARREIAHALHLHRSSSSSTSTKKPSNYDVAQEREAWMLGNPYSYSTSSNYTRKTTVASYSLVEAMPMPMPLPEPVWSTTAPSVAATPPGLEAMEFFEWGENQASSYTWWLGFLGALDGNNIEKTNHPFVDNIVKENPRVLEQQEISPKLGEPTNFVGSSDQNTCLLDEWLKFPTTEDSL